ncbi:unnamed protein product [Mucor hiemalis]
MRSISALFLTATLALSANAYSMYSKRDVSAQANSCVQSLNHFGPLFGDLNERVKRYETVNGVEYIKNDILHPAEQVAENIRNNLLVACCSSATERYSWNEITAIRDSMNIVGIPFQDFFTSLQERREELSHDGVDAVNTVKNSAAVLKAAISEFDACLPHHFVAEYSPEEFNSERTMNIEEMYQNFLSYYP